MRAKTIPIVKKAAMIAIIIIIFILPISFSLTAQNITVKATIIKAMSPVAPGETTMLTGDWPQIRRGDSLAGVEVELLAVSEKNAQWTRAKVIQLSAHSLKFTIPSRLPMDVFACRIVPVAGISSFLPSDTVYLNQADAWWLQGSNGGFSGVPGGWLRVFGNALYFTQDPKVKLTGNGKTYTLAGIRSKDQGGYAVTANIPDDIPKGIYNVSINNGLNVNNWSQNVSLQISTPTIWQSKIFNVKQYQSAKEAATQDGTAAFRAALAAAQANGGGIVYFPRGRYVINDMITIPPYVLIRGEGMGLVNLYWPPRTTALTALLRGNNNFAIENITLTTSGVHNNIIDGLNNVRIERVRIRANAYYRHTNAGIASSVTPVPVSSIKGGAGIKISGNNAQITGCDILHSVNAIEMYHTNGGIIARNTLSYGQSPMQLFGISHVVVEDNILQANTLWSGGIGISLHGAAISSYNLYFAHNESRQTFGGDREAVTTDGHGTAYVGKIQTADAVSMTLKENSWLASEYTSKDVVTFAELNKAVKEKINKGNEEYHGLTIYILSGRGAGQYRNVQDLTGKSVTIDSPWKVKPDTSSIVSIGKFQGRILFVGNQFRDAGTSVQLYPPNIDCIVAENQTWRAQSMSSSSSVKAYAIAVNSIAKAFRVEPSWYNQFINNRTWEGMSWDGNSSLSITGNGTLNTLNEAWHPDSPGAMLHIIRSNTFDNNASIIISGDVADVVLEKNNISNVAQGIIIKERLQPDPANPSRIFFGNNTFQKVDIPISYQ